MGCNSSRRESTAAATSNSATDTDRICEEADANAKELKAQKEAAIMDEAPIEGTCDCEALRKRMREGEEAAVRAVRETLLEQGSSSSDDVSILRALRFTDGNVGKATQLLQNYFEWAETIGVKELCDAEWNGTSFSSTTSEENLFLHNETQLIALSAGYFQYFAEGHDKRGCPIKVQANFRFRYLPNMLEKGLTNQDFLRYHISQMELHRYLLTIDQSSIGGKTHIRHPRTGQILPVPLHPERGAFVICDIRKTTASHFWGALPLLIKMIGIDKHNYHESMDRMVIVNAPWAFSNVAWPIVKPLLSKDVTERVIVVPSVTPFIKRLTLEDGTIVEDDNNPLLEFIDAKNMPPEFQTLGKVNDKWHLVEAEREKKFLNSRETEDMHDAPAVQAGSGKEAEVGDSPLPHSLLNLPIYETNVAQYEVWTSEVTLSYLIPTNTIRRYKFHDNESEAQVALSSWSCSCVLLRNGEEVARESINPFALDDIRKAITESKLPNGGFSLLPENTDACIDRENVKKDELQLTDILSKAGGVGEEFQSEAMAGIETISEVSMSAAAFLFQSILLEGEA